MNFFIPGIHPELSKAELLALNPELDVRFVTPDVIVAKPTRSMNDLTFASAGIVKAGTIFSSIETYDKETLAAILASTIEPGIGKVHLGISVYNAGGSLFSEIRRDAERLGLTLKTTLKDLGRPVRFVTSREPTLSSVVVAKNHLLDEGAEFVLIVTPEAILIGQTIFVQDFEAWGHRDFGRPERDAKSGMLPPKLARLMVNLTGQDPKNAVLWDPFCGSGTVLMESAMLEYGTVIGSDVSARAIEDTVRNLRWLKETFKTTSETILFQHDITEPIEEPLFKEVDVIVAEGYLGPPIDRHRPRSNDDHQHVTKELERLYERSLLQMTPYLKKNGVVILAIPCFQTTQGLRFLSLKLPEGLELIPFPEASGKNGGLTYLREGQRVGREIVKLRRL